MELTLDRNFKNYFHEYGAYQFSIDQLKCETLHGIFKVAFTKSWETYPNKENKLYHTLIIKDKIHLGYDGYEIHKRLQDIKEARKLQRKTTTTIEKEKLKQIRQDVKILEEMIKHTEIITPLRVFNVEILRQSSTRKYKLKETTFEWHINNEERKSKQNSQLLTYSRTPLINENYDKNWL